MNEVLQNIKARRSVRAYTDRQVSAQDLDLILEAAAYAPNGMHYETWHFTAIQDAAILTELNEAIKGAFAKSDEPRLRERGQSETYCCYYHVGDSFQRTYAVVGADGLCLCVGKYFPGSPFAGHWFLLDQSAGSDLR